MKCPRCNGTGEVSISNFSEVIHQQRRKLGWTQYHLADVACISRNMVNKVENDKTRPSLDLFNKLVCALGGKLSVVFPSDEGGDDENSV